MASSPLSKLTMPSLGDGSKHRNNGGNQSEIWRKGPYKERRTEGIMREDLNLDTHPALARLHNEQNLRLEGMEQRMQKIRKSAQQEAERRKFARLFRARSEDKSQTEQLLLEASLALQKLKEEKQLKKKLEKECVTNSCAEDRSAVNASICQSDTDKGDIIPVHIISNEKKSTVKVTEEQMLQSKVQQPLSWLLQPVETFKLDGVVLWLVLPFLLPVLLLLHLIRHFSPHSDSRSRKKN